MFSFIHAGLTAALWSSVIIQSKSNRMPDRIIDLRSDTVTRPTLAMRTAMFETDVGDDVFGEDPTVLKLQSKMSILFKKESALFFPSGTMSNLAAIMSLCTRRGSEMIVGDSSQIFLQEHSGISQIAGVLPRCLKNQQDGTIHLDLLERAVRESSVNFPVTEVIALEDTHDFCGGRVLPVGYLKTVGEFAKGRGIDVHLDGARIWNAAIASKTPVHQLVEGAGTVTVCLSKGLGAPSGSILLGSTELIDKARRYRKVLGGGMSQVGILAAAALEGIADFESGLLIPDHIKAKELAAAISNIAGFNVDIDSVETNIVIVGLDDGCPEAHVLAMLLKEINILVLPFGDKKLRLVTHRDILDADIRMIIIAFEGLMSKFFRGTIREQSISTSSAQEPLSRVLDPVQLPNMIDSSSRVTAEKSEYSRRLIERVLQNENVFRPRLSSREIKEIVEGAEGIRVPAGDTVIRQGDPAQFFYIIESGRVDRISADGSSLKINESLSDSGYFGEVALIYDAPRSATVTAAEETVLWRIHKKHFFFVCKSVNVTAADMQTSERTAHPAFGEALVGVNTAVKKKSTQPDIMDITDDMLYGASCSLFDDIVEIEAQVLQNDTSFMEYPRKVDSGARQEEEQEGEETIEQVMINQAASHSSELGDLQSEGDDKTAVGQGDEENIDIDINMDTDADMEHYEEVVIHGMSLSDDGFCVLLKGVVCERVLRLLVTPSDPMSDGLDRDQVDTSEAVTLLQLLQGIDVESILARDTLTAKFSETGLNRQHFVLKRVMIDHADSSKSFHALLLGSSLASASASNLGSEGAFAITVTARNTQQPVVQDTATYAQSAAFASALTPFLAEQESAVREGTSTTLPCNKASSDDCRVDKEVEILSAFEAIALALRHSSVIEVKSSLLQDESLSYTLEELPSFFPKLVKSDIPLEDGGRFRADYDSRSEIERLQRRLQEVTRQGQLDKVGSIKKQLEFYSNIEGKAMQIISSSPPPIIRAPAIDALVPNEVENEVS